MQLETRSGRRASQNVYELSRFVRLLRERRVRNYLEIGARHGDTFYDVMRALPAGSRGVAVDLPGGMWGTEKSRSYLAECIQDLRAEGYDVSAVFGDSRSEDVLCKVTERGMFDAVLIDGDHRYEGVKADWQNYRRMAPLVAFHDIVGDGQAEKVHGNAVEVPRLWAELKGQFDHVEFVDKDSAMGIGVVFPK